MHVVPDRPSFSSLFVGSAGDHDRSRERAQQLFREIRAGLSFDRARELYGEAAPLEIPEGPVTRTELRRRLGASLCDLALSLEVGQTSCPFAFERGMLLLHRLS